MSAQEVRGRGKLQALNGCGTVHVVEYLSRSRCLMRLASHTEVGYIQLSSFRCRKGNVPCTPSGDYERIRIMMPLPILLILIVRVQYE